MGLWLGKVFRFSNEIPQRVTEKECGRSFCCDVSIDTLGLPREINILTTIHKEFDKEIIRLTKELPHCLPCRDKNGKRIECFHTVYVPFLPQHYRDRVKSDSIAEEELKQSFVEWETVSYFEKANPYAVTNYINERLTYDPKLLNGKKEAKGIYTIRIDSYGEIIKVETLRSCGIPEWDKQVLQIIKGMPRWTPTINYYGKGEYHNSVWTVPVLFKMIIGKSLNEHRDYNWIIKTEIKFKLKMGTLGCINDMLQRDKENRELRKLNKERMKEHHKYLVNKGKILIYPTFPLKR